MNVRVKIGGRQGPSGPTGAGGASGVVLGTARPKADFGAAGDGVTDDTSNFSTASTALASAIAARTGGALFLEARDFKISGMAVPAGATIRGTGMQSVLKTTGTAAVLLSQNGNDCTFADFKIVGDYAGGAVSKPNQNGIEDGYLGGDGASRLTITNVEMLNMQGRGISLAFAPTPPYAGPQVTSARVSGCGDCAFGAYTQSSWSNCTATGNAVGLRVASGNVSFDGGDLSYNTIGIDIEAGGNDAHGVVSDTRVNHCTTRGIRVGAIANSWVFDNCRIYQSKIEVSGNRPSGKGCVVFIGCEIDSDEYIFTDARVRFVDCVFVGDYANTLTESGTNDIEFIGCRDKQGNVPAWIGARQRVAFTFGADADQALTWSQSRAQVIDVAAGVTTTTRTLTSKLPPNAAHSIAICNRNAQSVAFAWASGAGVVVPTGKTAIVDADGTKAVCRLLADNAASSSGIIDPATLALASWNKASFAGVPWSGTTSLGGSGSKTLQGPGGGADPIAGTAINGLASADLDGTKYLKDSVATMDGYISTTAYRIVMLANLRSLPAPAGAIYDNPGLFTESGGNFGVVYNSSGVHVYHSSALVASKAITTGVHLIDIIYDGSNVTVTVDGVAGTPGASGGTGTIAGGAVRHGANYSAAVKADLLSYEALTALVSLSSTSAAQFKAYVNDRYALSL